MYQKLLCYIIGPLKGDFLTDLHSLFNPLNPESDQHLISPYSNLAKSFVEIMRIKEITTQRSYGCKTNSPCQY